MRTIAVPEIPVIEEAIDMPLDQWAGQCHAVSLRVVKSRILEVPCRVARGACKGVMGQHSWVVVGMDCYDPDAPIVDPTLWSYDSTVEGVWVGRLRDGRHSPHGAGSIWMYGRPPDPIETTIDLGAPLSPEANLFMKMAAPAGLDRRGWSVLLHSPVEGWPAKEIITAASRNPLLSPIIPIDILGMVTDENPNGLYLAEEN